MYKNIEVMLKELVMKLLLAEMKVILKDEDDLQRRFKGLIEQLNKDEEAIIHGDVIESINKIHHAQESLG